MADDIVTRLRRITAKPVGLVLDPPPHPLCKEAADEIERLREQVAEMLPLFEDIVIGERIRERAANDNGHRTSLGEVAADFGIDLDADTEARRGDR